MSVTPNRTGNACPHLLRTYLLIVVPQAVAFPRLPSSLQHLDEKGEYLLLILLRVPRIGSTVIGPQQGGVGSNEPHDRGLGNAGEVSVDRLHHPLHVGEGGIRHDPLEIGVLDQKEHCCSKGKAEPADVRLPAPPEIADGSPQILLLPVSDRGYASLALAEGPKVKQEEVVAWVEELGERQ